MQCSTGRNKGKLKVVYVCDSLSVLLLEYKGNSLLDSPVVMTPGFLTMFDEIVERGIIKKKDFCKDDIPSLDLRITQLNEEDKNMDDKKGTKAVIRYTKKSVVEDKLKRKNGNDIMESEKVYVVDFNNGKGKRKGKLGQFRCSPYVDQITDMDETVKDDENVVAQSILTWGKDKR